MAYPDIEALVADLRPVRRLSPTGGVGALVIATTIALTAVWLVFGLRDDVLALRPAEMVVLRSGMLLLLGGAAAGAVIASARPAIGRRREGWRWALAAGALFPLASIALSLRAGTMPDDAMPGPGVLDCLGISVASAVVIGGALVVWLRRGAVTELTRAGWLTGLAAGALGTFAYSLHCPSSSVHYVAAWYTLAVGTSAVIGRLAVPRALKW